MRTLFLTLAFCVSLSACGNKKKSESKADTPQPTAVDEQPARPHKVQVKKMSPKEVKEEVNRAGKEYTDKVDKSLDY